MSPLAAGLNAYTRLVDIAYLNKLIIYSRRSRGTEGDHFLICPPMIINEYQIDEIIDNLVKSLDALAAEIQLPVADQ